MNIGMFICKNFGSTGRCFQYIFSRYLNLLQMKYVHNKFIIYYIHRLQKKINCCSRNGISQYYLKNAHILGNKLPQILEICIQFL